LDCRRGRFQCTPPARRWPICAAFWDPAHDIGIQRCRERSERFSLRRLAAPPDGDGDIKSALLHATLAAITTSGLSKDFGSGRGLFDLDLEVEQGEVFGFLGPNGAGKSTTMRLLLDLIKATSGSASVCGLDTRSDSLEIRRRVGFLPGDLALYPKLTGARVLDYLAELRGSVDRRVRSSLAERFDAQLDRPIRELSTGNRQKLGLIQAFMHEPEVLILDEPIAGLDPLVQQSFHALLGEVSAQGRTVFLSSHALSEVERVTHRVAILRQGRLVVVDSLENLREVAVHRLEIDFAAPAPAEEFRALPGVREADADGRHLTVAYEGSADPIVKAAAHHRVEALRPYEDDLGSIFLRYYGDDGST
jgi:ABC-2 type transport system ATP-binding protein